MSQATSNPTTATPTVVVRRYSARTRSTPLASRGEPLVWLTGAALAVCAIMVVVLAGVVIYNGAKTFWSRPIERVTATIDGTATTFLGVRMDEEAYTPAAAERDEIDALARNGKLPVGALSQDGRPLRRLYRVGNKDVRGQAFEWHPVWRITSSERPNSAVLVERQEWGVWLGEPTAVVQRDAAGKEVHRVAGNATVVLDAFNEAHAQAVTRRDRLRALKEHDIGVINAAIEAERLKAHQAELDEQRARTGAQTLLGDRSRSVRGVAAAVAAAVSIGAVVLLIARLRRSRPVEPGFLPPPDAARVSMNAGLVVAAIAAGIFAWTENPLRDPSVTPAQLAALKQESAVRVEALNKRFTDVQGTIAAIEAEDDRWRVEFTEPTRGVFAPQRQTELDQPMRVSQVVRVVPANALSFWGKLGVYFGRWSEFVFGTPREANTEGGIWPVIFGTITLTLLLSVVVVPMGVVAALYLREYAKQGFITSAVRIAVNNLAGVPSIVYGVFGLGFFCYTLGQFVDTGSQVNPAAAWSLGPVSGRSVAVWWVGIILLGIAVVSAVVMGMMSKPVPGKHAGRWQVNLARCGAIMWVACAVGAVALIALTPYFRGFFEAKAPSPTFAAKGMLWSAVTLALLTLPVVIVATEEAISAVPRTMREGSYGCGASKWQTIQRVVLPRAMPGIMTGMILAMARGAGEVAPLMLVGATKVASQLPVDGDAPFVHLERPFMHLGFHIYDVGFQSQDSDAARPLVWCTTLLLIVIVVTLNLAAIRIRTRLRKKFLGEAF